MTRSTFSSDSFRLTNFENLADRQPVNDQARKGRTRKAPKNGGYCSSSLSVDQVECQIDNLFSSLTSKHNCRRNLTLRQEKVSR